MKTSTKENNFIYAYRNRKEHLLIGIMSGTSLDGVDAVLIKIQSGKNREVESINLVHHVYISYSAEVRGEIAKLCSPESSRIDDLVYVHFGLSEWYAEAVSRLLSESGCGADRIDAISMHGQTIWHAPEPRDFPGPLGLIKVKGTLQIGNPSVLRERTGIPVISDLRSADMAAGGEGAPLAPFTDYYFFGSSEEGRIIQNIGGIGNATVLPMGSDNSGVFAFDTGPGNMIIDGVVSLGTGGELRYDSEGGIAARGRAAEDVIDALLRDPYFSRRPPKSTGREVYGAAFTETFLQELKSKGFSFEDAVATATAFTAESIARSYKDFILSQTSIRRVLVCGGGALNKTLLRMIAERLPKEIEVTTTASFGIPDQAREAMAFAFIGHESLMGRPGNLPAVTGARGPAVLGVLTL